MLGIGEPLCPFPQSGDRTYSRFSTQQLAVETPPLLTASRELAQFEFGLLDVFCTLLVEYCGALVALQLVVGRVRSISVIFSQDCCSASIVQPWMRAFRRLDFFPRDVLHQM